jgi:hypothetical protein
VPTNSEPLVDLVTLEKVHRLLADAEVEAASGPSTGAHRRTSRHDHPSAAMAGTGEIAPLPQRR